MKYIPGREEEQPMSKRACGNKKKKIRFYERGSECGNKEEGKGR